MKSNLPFHRDALTAESVVGSGAGPSSSDYALMGDTSSDSDAATDRLLGAPMGPLGGDDEHGDDVLRFDHDTVIIEGPKVDLRWKRGGGY